MNISAMDKQTFSNTLPNFTGGEQYFQHTFFNIMMHLTEGANFVREQGKAHWLIDLICSFHPQLRKEAFQSWTLKYLKENKRWKMVGTDGNKNVLAEQEFSFSDFPLEEITLWVEGNVILLPTE